MQPRRPTLGYEIRRVHPPQRISRRNGVLLAMFGLLVLGLVGLSFGLLLIG